MNKKGSMGILLGIMLGLMIWIAFVQTLEPVKNEIQNARGVNALDCINTTITTGNKAACVVVDWMLFGWAGAIVIVAVGAAGGKAFDAFRENKQ